MSDVNTNADAINKFLSGAASDGGVQADPDASLGNFRSSSRVEEIGDTISSTIANLTVDFAAGANGTGIGTISATGADTLAWAPPGSVVGADVTILDGETKNLEGAVGSAERGKFVRVSRTSAVALSGSASVTLVDVANNVIGMNDAASAERAAGSKKYRAVMLKNASAVTVAIRSFLFVNGTEQVSDAGGLSATGAGTIQTSGTFADWPDSGFCYNPDTLEAVYYETRTDSELTIPAAGRAALSTTAAAGTATDTVYPIPGLRVATELPVADAIQTIADEDTAPTGVTWNLSIDADNGLLDVLAAGEMVGLWIEREVVAGSFAAPFILDGVRNIFSL